MDTNPLVLGLVVTAYLAGVKHSYDWDHIAAIDNSSRKFAAQGRAPVSVGFAFSMGHSSVVMLAGILVVSGAGIMGAVLDDGSAANMALAVFGASVSALFLLTIGLFNGAAFLKAGSPLPPGAQRRHCRTTANWLPRAWWPACWTSRSQGQAAPRHLRAGFPVRPGLRHSLHHCVPAADGVGCAGRDFPVALLALPLAFTAAMTLCDTANGMAMMKMYRSAVMNPARRIGFNMVVTGLSATSALFISALTIVTILHDSLGWQDPVTTWLAELELGHAGLLLVGVFLLVWGSAAL